jgi:hypothetical protein
MAMCFSRPQLDHPGGVRHGTVLPPTLSGLGLDHHRMSMVLVGLAVAARIARDARTYEAAIVVVVVVAVAAVTTRPRPAKHSG